MLEPQYQMGYENKYERKPIKVRWDQLSKDEKEEIIENAKKKKEEKQRKKNIIAADIMLKKQLTQDNAWD
jgi:hypothetical protein